MTLIADVFPEILIPKSIDRLMSKEPCFRRLLEREHGKSVEKMFQSERQQFYKSY